MRCWTLFWPFALAAVSASPANPRSAWKVSGSGTDTTLTLAAKADATVRFDGEPAFEVGLRNQTRKGRLWLPQAVDPETVFFDKPERMAGSLLRVASIAGHG